MKSRIVPEITTALLVVGISSASCGPEDGTVTIDPSTTFQTMSGWEATAEVGSLDLKDPTGFDHYKDALYDDAVENLGINRLRVEVRAGAEQTSDSWALFVSDQMDYSVWKDARYTSVNDNADPFDLNVAGFIWSELDYKIENIVLPIKRRLEARGERLFLNLNYVAFSRAEPFVHNDPEEYAEMVLATVSHLDDAYQLIPDAWEVILEPDNRTNFDGKRIGAAIVAAGARLKAAGYEIPFIAPSTSCTDAASEFFDAIAAVPGASAQILELSYHRYCGGPGSDSVLPGILSRAKAIGANTSMLEHIGSDHLDLHEDLTVANVSAWQQFTLAFVGTDDPGGKYYLIDESVPAEPRPILSLRARSLRQYFHYVRRGAVRQAASSTTATYRPTAFRNANGTVVVVVQATAAGAMTIANLPPATYGISYTTRSETSVELPSRAIGVGQDLHTAIPATGVLTVYDVAGQRFDSSIGSARRNGPPRSR